MFKILLLMAAISATPEEASFRIETGNAGGSGTGIHPRIVVTNAHVVGNQHRDNISIKSDWSKETWTARTICVSPPYDIALLWVDGIVPHVEIADAPQEGSDVKLCGYGPDRRLKAGIGRVLGVRGLRQNGAENIETMIHSFPGDSGGGIFDADGRLVAVNWGGDRSINSSVSVPAKYVKHLGEQWATLTLPKDRWQEFQCMGGNCGGGNRQNAGNGGGVPSPKFPVNRPADNSPPPVPQPIAITPPKPIEQPKPVDIDQLAKSLIDKMAEDPRFKGPPGKDGKDGHPGVPGINGMSGKDGRDGKDATVDYDKLAGEVIARLPPLHIRNVDRVTGKIIDEEYYPVGSVVTLRYGVADPQSPKK